MLTRIEPVRGYSPNIGRLVCVLTCAREATVAAVKGLDQSQLDHVHDSASNSIGALLAHIAAVERYYQVLTFEGRLPSSEEEAIWLAALDLGDLGRRELRGHDLQWYLHELSVSRATTLTALGQRDDDWLERSLERMPHANAHWAWFHVAEDEIAHRGQMRWLRKRLPAPIQPSLKVR